MHEHRLIEEVLDCLEDGACRLDDGEDISADFFIDAAEFVTDFTDGSHHRKEEGILFDAMTAKDMPADNGPVAVMLHEHEQGRRLTEGFRTAAEAMRAGDSEASAMVVQNALDYVNLLRDHIMKEDSVLFPMADQVIEADKMQDLARRFDGIIAADKESGKSARYQELLERLKAL